MAPDYRSDKMGSIEGVSNARGRWFDWLSELSDDEAAFLMRMPNITVFTNLDRTRADKDEDAEPVDVKERSELLGFWIMWHLAGGFKRLEQWGWHRSTIHRKIRRFRDAYGGIHPDEYKFNWIDLDLDKAWSDSAEVYWHVHGDDEDDWIEARSRDPR
jgi:hypothetical protein